MSRHVPGWSAVGGALLLWFATSSGAQSLQVGQSVVATALVNSRASACGSVLRTVSAGSQGIVLSAPTTCRLGTITYNFAQIGWADGGTGWSVIDGICGGPVGTPTDPDPADGSVITFSPWPLRVVLPAGTVEGIEWSVDGINYSYGRSAVDSTCYVWPSFTAGTHTIVGTPKACGGVAFPDASMTWTFTIDYASPDSMDADADGVSDDADNCVSISNDDQLDADTDGRGNACDACPGDSLDDGDADGVCADADNCPEMPNPDQFDGDLDGAGDTCDACPSDAMNDADTDGACGDVDNCPLDVNPSQADADGDGLGDACDVPGQIGPEICGNNVDDDGDNLPDCSDHLDCAAYYAPLYKIAAPIPADNAAVAEVTRLAWTLPVLPHDELGVGVDGQYMGRVSADATFFDLPAPLPRGIHTWSVGVSACNIGWGANGNTVHVIGDGSCDTDGDNVCDLADNCPAVANADQVNSDGDVRGDACDNCPLVLNFPFDDSDLDGTGDACESQQASISRMRLALVLTTAAPVAGIHVVLEMPPLVQLATSTTVGTWTAPVPPTVSPSGLQLVALSPTGAPSGQVFVLDLAVPPMQPSIADFALADVELVDVAGHAVVGAALHITPLAAGDVAPLGARDGRVTVADAIRLLRAALGLESFSVDDVVAGDIAPTLLIEDGVPQHVRVVGDRAITVADVIVALRIAVGLSVLS